MGDKKRCKGGNDKITVFLYEIIKNSLKATKIHIMK